MDYLLYTQKYYGFIIGLFVVVSTLFFLKYYNRNNNLNKILSFIVITFGIYSVHYLGSRDINIGTDTYRYAETFKYFQSLDTFKVRKDPLFDYLNYLVSKFGDYSLFFYLIAGFYIFFALSSFRRIFGYKYVFPFLVFIISPYFFQNGVNVLRSGVAASLFLLSLALFYQKKSNLKIYSLFVLSVLTHVSMIIPVFIFLISKYIKNIKLVSCFWFLSIALGYLNINFIADFVSFIGVFGDRAGDYALNEGERSFWDNFLIFGFTPVIFALHNVYFLKFKDTFYIRLLCTYMLTHIPYIILLNSQYGLRLGYLAECMLPILLCYPLLKNENLRVHFIGLKLSLVLFLVFMIKAYKILMI